MVRICLGFLILLTLYSMASAYITYGNGRLDYALWPEHDNRMVVVGQLVPTCQKGSASAKFPEGRNGLAVQVEAVILGDEDPKYLTEAAKDIQEYMKGTTTGTIINGPGTIRTSIKPERELNKHYLFIGSGPVAVMRYKVE